MMGAVQQVVEPIFQDAGQAVHVAFLVMAQPARQDAPFRKALMRSMESIKLSTEQRHWLDQLRGEPSGRVNFEGLDMNDVRAQCALITQAVATRLPGPERWVLLAKYGQTDFEDIVDDEPGSNQVAATLDRMREQVEELTAKMQRVRSELETTKGDYISATQQAAGTALEESAQMVYQAARDAVRDVGGELARAEANERAAQIALERLSACALMENGPRTSGRLDAPRRRFAFSAERIMAIDGLAQWFAPMFPRLKLLAINCMLGRMFANHKKIDISARDLATSFGGSHSTYLRASWKMKNHVRQLEDNAIERLAPYLSAQGMVWPVQKSC